MRKAYLYYILCVVAGLLKGTVHAQIEVEALDRGGQQSSGRLVWDAEQQRWWVQTVDKERKALENYQLLRLQPPVAAEPTAAPDFEVQLWGSERLSLRVGATEDGTLTGRFAGGSIRLPLASIAWLTHFGEMVPVCDLDFDGTSEPPGVQFEGDARVAIGKGSEQSGALEVHNAGDQAVIALSQGVTEGIAQLLYNDPGPTKHRRGYLMEFLFRRGARKIPLQVLLLPGSEVLALAMPEGPPTAVEPIERRAGWHRLVLTLQQDRVLVTVDDAVLAVFHQPLGELIQLTLGVPRELGAARPQEGQAPEEDEPLWVDDLEVRARRASQLGRQPAPDQDEVMLYGGSEFYGELVSIDAGQLTLKTDYGTLHFPWQQVYRLYLRPRSCAPIKLFGQRARILFRPNAGLAVARRDNLEGILLGPTEGGLVLQHPTLGRLEIPLALVELIAPGRYGHWLLVDHGFHHLGDAVEPDMQRPYAEGSTVSWTFELQQVPARVWLVLDVIDMEPMVQGASYYQELKAGHLRTVVELNGKEIDFVNRYLSLGRRRRLQRVRIPLPQDLLRQGKNVLRLTQRPQRDKPDSYDDCGISWVSLEWPPEDDQSP